MRYRMGLKGNWAVPAITSILILGSLGLSLNDFDESLSPIGEFDGIGDFKESVFVQLADATHAGGPTGGFSVDGLKTFLDVSAIVHPVVNDHTLNLDPNVVDSLPVTITSKCSEDEITLTLPETGPNTGIFGGDSLSDLLFLVGNDLVTTSSIMTVIQEAPNDDDNVRETIIVTVTSTSDPNGVKITLQETDVASGTFSGQLELNPVISAAPPFVTTPSLLANGGDIITILYNSETYHTLVTPNPNPANGALQVEAVKGASPIVGCDFASDEVTLSYNPSFMATVSDAKAPGGGGGGLVRPGLVVNVLAGASSISSFLGTQGGGSGPAAPIISSSSLSLEPEAGITQLGEGSSSGGQSLLVNLDDSSGPITIQTGEATTFTFDIYANQGIQDLEHSTMYFFTGEDANLNANHNDISKSDAYILFDTTQSIHVTDPHGYFEDASFDVSEIDPWNLQAKYDITFAKSMDTSSLLIRTWDHQRNTADKVILNAIEVVEPSFLNVPLELTSQDSAPTQTDLEDIPIWVKNNAMWWQQKQIDDSDFVSGIEYLINENIIRIPETQTTAATTDEIPGWISEVAGFWAHDEISNAEFVQAMQWLISNGAMVIA